MNAEVSAGRKLLMQIVDAPEIAQRISDDQDLILAGINSGDLIRLGLAIEEKTRRPLSDDDLVALQTVAGIDRVLAARVPE